MDCRIFQTNSGGIVLRGITQTWIFERTKKWGNNWNDPWTTLHRINNKTAIWENWSLSCKFFSIALSARIFFLWASDSARYESTPISLSLCHQGTSAVYRSLRVQIWTLRQCISSPPSGNPLDVSRPFWTAFLHELVVRGILRHLGRDSFVGWINTNHSLQVKLNGSTMYLCQFVPSAKKVPQLWPQRENLAV
jgi:hypothetical protein